MHGELDGRPLRNHWSRPPVRSSYYWYLTFEGSPQLREYVRRCHREISFSYLDLVAEDKLHLTLDRIALEGDVGDRELRSLSVAATEACRRIPRITATTGAFGVTRSAVGFAVESTGQVEYLRATLREVGLAVPSESTDKDGDFRPHISVAYCNTDGAPRREVTEAVARLNAGSTASFPIVDVALVLLSRLQRSYTWATVARIPLAAALSRSPAEADRP